MSDVSSLECKILLLNILHILKTHIPYKIVEKIRKIVSMHVFPVIESILYKMQHKKQ